MENREQKAAESSEIAPNIPSPTTVNDIDLREETHATCTKIRKRDIGTSRTLVWKLEETLNEE